MDSGELHTIYTRRHSYTSTVLERTVQNHRSGPSIRLFRCYSLLLSCVIDRAQVVAQNNTSKSNTPRTADFSNALCVAFSYKITHCDVCKELLNKNPCKAHHTYKVNKKNINNSFLCISFFEQKLTNLSLYLCLTILKLKKIIRKSYNKINSVHFSS